MTYQKHVGISLTNINHDMESKYAYYRRASHNEVKKGRGTERNKILYRCTTSQECEQPV
jgi:hypothetical protein